MNKLQEAINNRISIRTFKDQIMDITTVNQIKSIIEETNKVSNLSICILEDGSDAFNSLKKSYGMFKNVRFLIVLKGNKDDSHLSEKVGYYGEKIVLELTSLNLGTCWVGGTYNKNNLIYLKEDERIICVITVGLIKGSKSLKEQLIRKVLHSKIKPISERLISDKSNEDWLIKGVSNVLLAPSALNSQKPVFIYKNGVLSVSTEVKRDFDLVDLGIAKLHFEIGALGNFDLGNDALFHKE